MADNPSLQPTTPSAALLRYAGEWGWLRKRGLSEGPAWRLSSKPLGGASDWLCFEGVRELGASVAQNQAATTQSIKELLSFPTG